MILTLGVFLFNLMCGLVPCDPKYQSPEILAVPKDQAVRARNIAGQNVLPIVKTLSGALEGYVMKSTIGRDFFAFEGIPYGESTAGPRRWQPPVPKRPWRGLRQAKKPGSDCTQISLIKLLRVYGSEDCLFMNIYTPELPMTLGQEKLPVVVFIHGGSFLFGSGTEYGPSYLMNRGKVVYVNFNYRLGPLGFISTGDTILPGNYGLKDQALALKWIHENIEFFGGNPKNVTLVGNSAGAVSTHLHVISNKTRDYFSNAFSSSGTAFHDWGVQSKEYLLNLTNKLASRFGCQNSDSLKLRSCLERVDANFIVAQQLQLFEWFPVPPVLFSPIVEPEHPDAFLTISPEEAYKTGAVANKPYVFGMTKDEGKSMIIILLPFMKTFPLRVMWDRIAPVFLQYRNLVKNPDEITRKLESFYFKGKSARRADISAFAEMVSDRYLSVGIVKGMQAHASSGAPTYMYHFSFSDGNHNLANAIGYQSNEWGASHSEDMFYFFNDSTVYDGQRLSDPDHDLSSIMINLLTNFASSGKPSYETETNELVDIWEPVTNPSKIRALRFDKQVEMIPLPFDQIERINFWTNLNLPNLSLWEPLESNSTHKKR